jgi:hypothetical protein
LASQYPTLSELRQRIKIAFAFPGTRFRIIPLAPLGADFSHLPRNELPLTRDRLKPLNIYAPLLLAIEHRKQKLSEVRQRRSELEAEFQRVDEDIARARYEEQKVRRAEIETARRKLHDLKDRVESAESTAGEALHSCIREARRIAQVCKSLGDDRLANQAAQMARLIASIREKRVRQRETETLELELAELDKEVNDALDKGFIAWASSPVNTWLSKLEAIEEKARGLRDARLTTKCGRLISRVRHPQFHNWLIVVAVSAWSLLTWPAKRLLSYNRLILVGISAGLVLLVCLLLLLRNRW